MTLVQKTSHVSPFRAILIASGSVALLGLLAANLSSSTAVRSQESTRLPTASGRASNAVAPAATMPIVPAAVLDQGAQRFVGTGDGSAGSWVP
jgi:hypothetical protein